MNRQYALYLCIGLIAFLFSFDFKRRPRVSWGFWIPYLWLFVISSRPASQWLGVARASSDVVDQYSDGSPFDRSFFLVLIFAAILILYKRRFSLGRFLVKNRWLTVFFFYCAISIFWSDFPGIAFKRWFKAVGEIAIILVVLTEDKPLDAIVTLIKRCAYVQIPLSVIYIKFFSELGRGYTPQGSPDYHGVCLQKNSLGLLCLFVGLTCVWSLFQTLLKKNNKIDRGAMAVDIAMLLMIAYLLRTANSATSLACLLIGTAVIVVMGIPFVKRYPQSVLALSLAVAVLVFLVQGIANVKSTAFEGLGRDDSLTGRTEIWEQVLSRVKNPVFGVGFDSFWLGDRLKSWQGTGWSFVVTTSHNGYIETYINIGALGLVFLGLLLLASYSNCIKNIHYHPEFARLSIAFFVTALASNLTEANFRSLSLPWFILLLTCGICFQKEPNLESIAEEGKLSIQNCESL